MGFAVVEDEKAKGDEKPQGRLMVVRIWRQGPICQNSGTWKNSSHLLYDDNWKVVESSCGCDAENLKFRQRFPGPVQGLGSMTACFEIPTSEADQCHAYSQATEPVRARHTRAQHLEGWGSRSETLA
jgi:hypothetical protein